jgi:hypothetical protein
MNLWGDELTPKAIPAKDLKVKPKKSIEEEKKEDFIKDHIGELSEDSSPKAWLIQIRRMQDDIKHLKAVQSEIKDLREFVSRNERRLSTFVQDLKELDLKKVADAAEYAFKSTESNSKDIEMLKLQAKNSEEFMTTASEFLDKINKVLGEDTDE